MSKEFFRWLRGELNGFYITNLNMMMNKYTKDVKSLVTEFNNMQFEKGKINNESLYGIGKTAGIFLPRMSRSEAKSAFKMSETCEVDGEEFSERGLFNTDTELFEFFHTTPDGTGLPDINTLATDYLRSSLVGDEEVLGYISSEETELLDDDGKVRLEKVLSAPPEGAAYSEFYGNKFLFLSEAETVYTNLEPSLYIELYKAMQWIRYNGTSVSSLCKIIATVCPGGLVTIDRIEVASDKIHFIVYYRYNESVEIDLKQQRLQLLEFILARKFVQIIMFEVI